MPDIDLDKGLASRCKFHSSMSYTELSIKAVTLETIPKIQRPCKVWECGNMLNTFILYSLSMSL